MKHKGKSFTQVYGKGSKSKTMAAASGTGKQTLNLAAKNGVGSAKNFGNKRSNAQIKVTSVKERVR